MVVKFLFTYSLFELFGLGMLLMLEIIRMLLLGTFPAEIVKQYDASKNITQSFVGFYSGRSTTPDPAIKEIRNQLITSSENEAMLFAYSFTELILMLLASICIIYATKNGKKSSIRKQRMMMCLSSVFVVTFLIVCYSRITILGEKGPQFKLNILDITIVFSKIMIMSLSLVYCITLGKPPAVISTFNNEEVEKNVV